MRVFLLGGTGAIGRHALPALVASGHEVSALARTPEKAAAVHEQGGAPVAVSMFDRTALSDAFRGQDAVVNLATSMPSTATFMFRRAWADTERVRMEGSAAVVDAALAAGVRTSPPFTWPMVERQCPSPCRSRAVSTTSWTTIP